MLAISILGSMCSIALIFTQALKDKNLVGALGWFIVSLYNVNSVVHYLQ